MPPRGPEPGTKSVIDRAAGWIAVPPTIRISLRPSTADNTAIWRSRIDWPSTTSELLSCPPKRVARPPARIAALRIARSYSDHARSRHWTRARGQPPSRHRRHIAYAPHVLRELAERRRAP